TVALVAAAWGTRLDERAVRRAQGQASESRRVLGGDASSPDQAGAAAGDASTGPAASAGGGTANAASAAARRAAANLPTPSAGVSGDAIKIGGIFPLSGGLSALGRPVEQAARAYFRSVNDAGGVNGRRIDFIAEDDAADPNR